MSEILSSEQIKDTESFKILDKAIQPIYLKRATREQISHALIVYKNIGYINTNLGIHQTLILKDLIKINL